jgi:hypothetical protein
LCRVSSETLTSVPEIRHSIVGAGDASWQDWLMLKRRQLENFTVTRLAGLCRVIAANPAMDSLLAERARLLELEWEALQVIPSTYTARREHHRKMKELTTKMVEFLATS